MSAYHNYSSLWESRDFLTPYFGKSQEAIKQFTSIDSYRNHDAKYRSEAYKKMCKLLPRNHSKLKIYDIHCGNGLGALFLWKELEDLYTSIELVFVDSSQIVCDEILPEHIAVFEKCFHVSLNYRIVRKNDVEVEISKSGRCQKLVLWERQIGAFSDPVCEIRTRITSNCKNPMLVGHYLITDKVKKEDHKNRYQSKKSLAMIDSFIRAQMAKGDIPAGKMELFVEAEDIGNEFIGQRVELGAYLHRQNEITRFPIYATRQYTPEGWNLILRRSLPEGWLYSSNFPISNNGLSYTYIYSK